MNLDELKISDVRQILALFSTRQESPKGKTHPMLGKRVLVRTYSAGVHIGTLDQADGMECKLSNALRLWKWEGGGLSLSAVANNGIKGGRLNKTGEVYLTNAIEYIPTTQNAEETYVRYIED